MQRTLTQNKRMWQLIHSFHYKNEEVEMMVLSYTSGRTTSTKEMTMEECRNFIGWMENQLMGKIHKQLPYKTKVQPGDKQRKQIFSIMYEMHIIHSDMSSPEKTEAINKYLMECKSTIHKQLKELTEDELQKTVFQLNTIKNNQLNKK